MHARHDTFWPHPSGKTHTMSGTDVAHISGRGLNYRTLDDLFQLNRER